MAGEVWESCPRCKSNRVHVHGKAFFFILGLMCTGVFFWLGFLLPPLWLGAIIGVAFMIGAPFSPPVLQCQDCNKSWRYKKPARK